jgi:hypothetical protein
MNDTYILDKIEDKPGAFFKRLSPYWFYQLTYSVTFKEWAEEGEHWMVEDILTAANFKPNVANEMANIINCLQDEYPDTDYDYKDHTYVSLAILLHKEYSERIVAYFRKKNHPVFQGNLSYIPKPKEAWQELVQRGFIPEFLNEHDKKKYYLRSTIGQLVKVDIDATTTAEAQREQIAYGVMGYTGYFEPKS